MAVVVSYEEKRRKYKETAPTCHKDNLHSVGAATTLTFDFVDLAIFTIFTVFIENK